MSVCVCVCLFVHDELLRNWGEPIKGVWYGWKQNLSGSVFIYISSLSDYPFGRYCPKPAHRWKTFSKKY